MKLQSYLIVCAGLYSGVMFAQELDTGGAEANTVLAKLSTSAGVVAEIDWIVRFDGIKTPMDRTEGGFEDPYGTLDHSLIFTFYIGAAKADERSRLSVGVFKEGRVVGRLDNVVETLTSSTGRIKTTADLNRDGKVEIVMTRTIGVSPPQWEEYWIFSWDGSQLRLVSAIDKEMKESAIRSPWNFLQFVDLDGDGIYELVTSFEDEKGIERQHIYSWNGKLYGEWGKSSKALLKRLSKKRK